MPLGNGFFLILAVAGLRSSAWSRSMPCPKPTGVAASALAGWPSSWPPHCLAASPGHMQSRPAVIFILAAGTREDESIGNGHAARLAAAQVSGSDGVNVPCPMVSPRGGSRSSTSCGVDLLRAAGPQLGGLPRIVYPCTVDNACRAPIRCSCPPRLVLRPVPPLSPGATIHAPAALPARCDGSGARPWGCSPGLSRGPRVPQ